MSSRTFDDRDPAIQYSGLWRTAGNSLEEYNGTTTLTNAPGSIARVTFTGTGIDVFGTVAISEAQPESTYTIDDDPLTTTRYAGVPTNEIQYGVKFYGISDLQLGRHILVITNEQSNAELFLDYFTVTGPSQPNPLSSSPVPSPVSSSSIVSLPSNSASSNPGGQSASPPLGPIIGGALGGLALICLLAVGIVFYRGRRRRGHAETGPDQESAVPPITPFLATGPEPPNTSQIPHDFSSASKSGSSASAPIFHSGKQPSFSQSGPSSLPMSSTSSDVTSLQAHHSTTAVDPPPRYEKEPSSQILLSTNRH